jgi:hypothetical protein
VFSYGRGYKQLRGREEEQSWRPTGGGERREFIGKHIQFIKNTQGDFGHFREKSLVIFSKVAKITLNLFYEL